MALLLEIELGIVACLLLVQGGRDALVGALEVGLELLDVGQLLLKLHHLGLEVLLVLAQQLDFPALVVFVLLQFLLSPLQLFFQTRLLVNLGGVFGASKVNLLLVDTSLQDERLLGLLLESQLLLQSRNFLIDLFDFVVEAVLLNVLVLGVLVDLLVDVGFYLCNLLSLAAHLLGIFSDADALVVQSLLLLVDGQLLGFLIGVHLRLLGRANFIQAGLAFLHQRIQLLVLVSLSRLERCSVFVKLLVLGLLRDNQLLDTLNLQVQLLCFFVLFSLGRFLLALLRLILLLSQDLHV